MVYSLYVSHMSGSRTLSHFFLSSFPIYPLLVTVFNNAQKKGEAIAEMAVCLALDRQFPDTIQLEKGKYYYVPYEKITAALDAMS